MAYGLVLDGIDYSRGAYDPCDALVYRSHFAFDLEFNTLHNASEFIRGYFDGQAYAFDGMRATCEYVDKYGIGAILVIRVLNLDDKFDRMTFEGYKENGTRW